MTTNRLVSTDLPGPLTARTVDSWNVLSAGLPGLVNFLQPSPGSVRIGSGAYLELYDRVARAYWRSEAPVSAGALGPNLKSMSAEIGYSLEWFDGSLSNALDGPSTATLPDEGTIILIVECPDYDTARVLFASATSTGNYVQITLTASGEIEVLGASGATLAATTDIRPYEGPLLIAFSYSATSCKVSVNGTAGPTVTAGYAPNDDTLVIGDDLDDGARLYAAIILDVDYQATAYAAAFAAYASATGRHFGMPFEIEWDFADLGDKIWLDLAPADLADGDVASWTDRATGLVFTEATHQPSKSVDGDGIAWLEFDATNQERIRYLAIPDVAPTAGETGEVFMLVDAGHDLADTSTGTLFGYGIGGAGLARRFERTCNGTIVRLKATTNNSPDYAFPSWDYLDKHVIDGRFQSNTIYLYGDSSLLAQNSSLATPIATSTIGRIAIGCTSGSESNPAGFCTFKLGYLVATRDGITDAERDLIHGKLAFIGGTQDLLPAGHPYKRATFV